MSKGDFLTRPYRVSGKRKNPPEEIVSLLEPPPAFGVKPHLKLKKGFCDIGFSEICTKYNCHHDVMVIG